MGKKVDWSSQSLIFEINNGLKTGYNEHEKCDAVIKSIASDSALRTYLEGKDNLNLKTMSRILRSHFKEPNATSLFTELSNSKQLPSECAQKYVVRLMSLRQKILFISKEDNYGYSEAFVEDRSLNAILFGLRNDNIRNKLRPLLKTSILADEDILENLMLATSDEQEHFQNFNKKRVDINSIESFDAIHSAIPPKYRSENPIIAEIKLLKAMHNSISSWKNTFEKRKQSRLPKHDTLPRRCTSCHQNNVSCCVHCFYCDSLELFLAGHLKQKQDQKNKKKITNGTSSGSEKIQNVNNIEKSRCCLNCKRAEKEVVNLFRCQNSSARLYCSSKCGTLDSDNHKIFWENIVALEKLEKNKKFSNFEISHDTLLKLNQQMKLVKPWNYDTSRNNMQENPFILNSA